MIKSLVIWAGWGDLKVFVTEDIIIIWNTEFVAAYLYTWGKIRGETPATRFH